MYPITKRKVRQVTTLLFVAIVCYFAVRETVYQRFATFTKRKLVILSQPWETRAASFDGTSHHEKAVNVTAGLKTRLVNVTHSHAPMYSDKVINPHPFHFTISNRNACVEDESKDHNMFLLILVKIRPGESFDRGKIRKTWGGVSEVDGRRTLTMFLVGMTNNATINAMVVKENEQYNDIIQEDFIDDYRNLTYKTIMGWRWAVEICPDAEYVASADADVLLNVPNIVRRLVNKPRKKYAEGHLQVKAKPFRGRTKWRTSLELYPEPTYAPYFSGVCYVLSADVAASVFRESVHVRFLPWDDVFVGLVLQKLALTPINVAEYLQFRKTDWEIESALAVGSAVLVGNDSDHVGMKRGPNDRLVKIWERVAKKQNGTKYRRKNNFYKN